MDELKACPFCGNALEYAEYPWRKQYKPSLEHCEIGGFRVVCNFCNASGPSSGEDHEAIEWWNDRHLYEKVLDKL